MALRLLQLATTILFAPYLCALCASTTSLRSFHDFVTVFNRTYQTPAERAFRKKVYFENLKRMKAMKRTNPFAQFSAITTQWSDMTEEEFTHSHGYGSTPGLPCQATGTDKPFPLLKPTTAPHPTQLREACNVPKGDSPQQTATIPRLNGGCNHRSARC